MAAIAAGMLLLSPAARGDIYGYRDKNGVLHLTDRPPGPHYRLVRKTSVDAARGSASKPGSRERYIALVRGTASRWRLEEALLDAVIQVESNYNPKAVSRAGAMGLMQLMPATAERFKVDDPWDPAANLEGGARYLRYLLDRFEDLSLALAAYNAGEQTVTDYGNRIPPYAETRDYVQKVLSLYRSRRVAGTTTAQR